MSVLEEAMRDSALTTTDLWLRYLSIGGLSMPVEFDAYIRGSLEPDDHQYDLIAAALNDRFVELGGDHPVSYRGPTYEFPSW